MTKSCPDNLAFLQLYSSHLHTNENNNKVNPNLLNIFFLQYRLRKNNSNPQKEKQQQNNSQRDKLLKLAYLVSITWCDDRS